MYGFGVPPCTAPFAIQAPGQLYPIPPAAGVVGNGMLGAPPILPSPTLMQDWATPQALEEATKEYESISKELEDLDRYLAMRFQIDPTAKRILVEQRVELVEKKNAARSSKELIETALQTLAKQANNSQDTSQQDPQQQQQPVSEGVAPFMNGFCGQVPPWAPTFIPNPMNIPSTASGYVPPIPNQTPLLNPYQAAAPPINAIPGTASQIPAYQSDEYSPRETSRNKASQAVASAGISAIDRGERWDKASENAPPEIMRVYHNLENAVKTGANLEPHLRELSTAILSLKHKKSVLQRSRESSKDMSKDRGTSKTKGNGQEAANPSGVTEQAQGDRSGKKPAAKESNEKRRFRKKKEVRPKRKDSKATTSDVTEDSREQGPPVLEAEEAKTTSQIEPTPTSANSPEQSKIPGNSRASQVRYTAETFTPLAQQLEAQVKASESSAEGTNGMKDWTPTGTCDEENDQRRPRSSGEESAKTKESSSGRFFGWFRRALSPSPESQAAKSLAQNLKQTGREAKKAQNEGKHGQRARIFSQ
ncbi:hypothetical protein KEM55_005712 [Ascosphaera atra]|nr:hypothetical protein KEM55_005712 [Ascosphaera atra]